jgi:hypothetical protein
VIRDDSNICSRNTISKSRISDGRRSAESPETVVGTQCWRTHAKYGWLQTPTTDMRPRRPNGATLICFSEGLRHIWAKADADEGQREHAQEGRQRTTTATPVMDPLFLSSNSNQLRTSGRRRHPSPWGARTGWPWTASWAAGQCGRTLGCALTPQLGGAAVEEGRMTRDWKLGRWRLVDGARATQRLR